MNDVIDTDARLSCPSSFICLFLGKTVANMFGQRGMGEFYRLHASCPHMAIVLFLIYYHNAELILSHSAPSVYCAGLGLELQKLVFNIYLTN